MTSQLGGVLQRLRSVMFRRDAEGLTDGRLLELFLATRDGSAFEALVRRHGPMVLGVCRRVLGNVHEAEDAFQATFLVLVRRADSIRPREMVGNFLYGVAYRTALEARRARARRRAREREASAMPRPEPAPDAWEELRPLLDRELARLPDKYRAPLVLCDLEGKTRKEAADRLGWPEGTVASRLARARSLLARRLTRRGVTLSGAAVAVTLSGGAASAQVPAELIVVTTRAATAAGVIPMRVAVLVEGVLKAMLKTKLQMVALVLAAALTLLGGGAGLFLRAGDPSRAPSQPAAKAAAAPATALAAADAKDADDKEESPTIASLPPVVVRTVPRSGDAKVDATKTKEIRVTFSKKMMDKSWSWVQVSKESFPEKAGDVRYEKDGKTCVMPVKLQPGKTYVIWLNFEQYQNFKDEGDRPAVPYLLVFETKR